MLANLIFRQTDAPVVDAILPVADTILMDKIGITFVGIISLIAAIITVATFMVNLFRRDIDSVAAATKGSLPLIAFMVFASIAMNYNSESQALAQSAHLAAQGYLLIACAILIFGSWTLFKDECTKFQYVMFYLTFTFTFSVSLVLRIITEQNYVFGGTQLLGASFVAASILAFSLFQMSLKTSKPNSVKKGTSRNLFSRKNTFAGSPQGLPLMGAVNLGQGESPKPLAPSSVASVSNVRAAMMFIFIVYCTSFVAIILATDDKVYKVRFIDMLKNVGII